MRQILLILIGITIVTQADRFTKDGDIVTDTQTNLQWQNELYTQAEEDAYNDNSETGKVLYWQSAIDYCEALTLGGKEDWRLPNFNELYYIADRSISEPAIDTIFNLPSDLGISYYWSATTNASNSDYAWSVYIEYGVDVSYDKGNSCFVRCVR